MQEAEVHKTVPNQRYLTDLTCLLLFLCLPRDQAQKRNRRRTRSDKASSTPASLEASAACMTLRASSLVPSLYHSVESWKVKIAPAVENGVRWLKTALLKDTAAELQLEDTCTREPFKKSVGKSWTCTSGQVLLYNPM
jgi:hypothetical protein